MEDYSSVAGIIFDFDGVIALSEEQHLEAWDRLAEEYGQPLPEGFRERALGWSDEALAEELHLIWKKRWSFDIIINTKRAIFQRSIVNGGSLVGGVKRAIQMFSTIAPLAIATSSCRGDIDPILDYHQLRSYFAAIISIEDVVKEKPDPEPYLKAAAAIGVEPEGCWVFEDSVYGVTAARCAGMQVVGLTTSFPSEKLQPVRAVFEDFMSFDQMIALMKKGGE